LAQALRLKGAMSRGHPIFAPIRAAVMAVAAREEVRLGLCSRSTMSFTLAILAIIVQSVPCSTSAVRRASIMITDGGALTVHGEDAQLVFYVVIYVASAVVALGLIMKATIMIKVVRRRYHIQNAARKHPGMLFASELPWLARGSLGMLVVVIIVVPICILTTSLSFGPVLAALEGWHVIAGIEYVLDIILPVTLTSIEPASIASCLIAYVFKIWALLVVTCTKGIVAQMTLIQTIVKHMPPTFCGLIRYLVLYVPVLSMLLACITGGLVALAEDWPFFDGFLYMARLPCNREPQTPEGHLVEIICLSVELALAGVMLGIIGKHPVGKWIVNRIEGVPEWDDVQESESKSSLEVKSELSVVSIDFGAGCRADEIEVAAKPHNAETSEAGCQTSDSPIEVVAEPHNAETSEVGCQTSDSPASAVIRGSAGGDGDGGLPARPQSSASLTEDTWQWLFSKVTEVGDSSGIDGDNTT